MYRERVGALWLHEQSTTARETAWQNILVLARSLWSMPPDHGAAVVRLILEDESLAEDWRTELDGMRDRLNKIRRLLADADPTLASVGTQRGMFGLLPISPEDVATLRREHAIYMAGSGRINIAGLTPDTIGRFAAAVVPYLSNAAELRGD